MIDRIFKSWKTTVTGVSIMVLSAYALVYTEAGITEVGGFLVLAFGLFFLKDSQSK